MGKLKIVNTEYRVTSASYSFDQDTDMATGVARGDVRAGIINLEILYKHGAKDILKWASGRSEKRNGSITFEDSNTGQKSVSISFVDGFLVSLSGTGFDLNDGVAQLKQILVISAKEITIDGVTFKNKW